MAFCELLLISALGELQDVEVPEIKFCREDVGLEFRHGLLGEVESDAVSDSGYEEFRLVVMKSEYYIMEVLISGILSECDSSPFADCNYLASLFEKE